MHPNPFKPLVQSTSSGRFTVAPVTIAATTSASAVTPLPGSATEDVNADIRVENQTNGWAYCVFSDITAQTSATTSNGMAIAPGGVEIFELDPKLGYVSVILAAGATAGNVRFTRGLGL